MSKKRFTNVGKDIFQHYEWYCSADGEHCADVIATALNEFCEENEQLKKQRYDLYMDIARLVEENEQLKQQLFEARKDYLIETADISDKPYLDDEIEKERREIFGDVE